MASQKRPVAMVTGGTRGIGSGEVGAKSLTDRLGGKEACHPTHFSYQPDFFFAFSKRTLLWLP